MPVMQTSKAIHMPSGVYLFDVISPNAIFFDWDRFPKLSLICSVVSSLHNPRKASGNASNTRTKWHWPVICFWSQCHRSFPSEDHRWWKDGGWGGILAYELDVHLICLLCRHGSVELSSCRNRNLLFHARDNIQLASLANRWDHTSITQTRIPPPPGLGDADWGGSTYLLDGSS